MKSQPTQEVVVFASRRNCGATVAGVAAFLAQLAVFSPITLGEPPRPNILLIVADDLGWGDVGWHDGFAKTPNLDRLVKEGIDLDQHYVQPVCTPTRTALMSGRYPGRFGPHALAPSNLRAMPLETVTLAAMLKSLGYYTVQSGKWHLGSKPQWGPTHFGFEHGYGTLTGAADPWTHKYRKGPYEDTWHRDGKLFHEDGNATDLIAAEVVRRIQEKKSPWFIYVPFHAVHTPVDAPDEYKRIYDGVKFDDQPARQDSRLRMAAMVSQLDAKVGQFIDALEQTEQRDNTLIIFTSDNGGIESLKNDYVGKVGDSPLNSENDPLRDQKGSLYEGGVRVCAFVHWRGVLKPSKWNTPMHVCDWFPTIAALVEYRPENDLQWDGVNQWPALSGKTPPAAGPRTIYIASGGGHALRHGDWKLIAHPRKTELFNLAKDPYEKQNVVDKHPQQAAELRKLLTAQQALDVADLPSDLVGQPR